MSIIKRLSLSMLIFGIILCGGCSSCVLDQNEPKMGTIKYITEENTDDFDIKGYCVEKISKSDLASLNMDDVDNILIDSNLFNEDVKDVLNSAYLHNARILILGDLSKNDVREYFGLKKKEYKAPKKDAADEESMNKAEIEAESGDTLEDVSTFKSIGILIYQDSSEITILTDLKVKEYDNKQAVVESITHCLNYDYSF